MKDPDWPIIKARYVTGEDLSQLAARYGMNLVELKELARQEHWLLDQLGFRLHLKLWQSNPAIGR